MPGTTDSRPSWTQRGALNAAGARSQCALDEALRLRSGRGDRSRRKRPVLVVLLAFAAIIGLSSCSGIPQTVITVPGSYTFGRGPSGIAGGTAVLCVDEHTAMQVTASWSWVSGNLVWDGTNYPITIEGPPGTAWTSPPLGPGCGTISAATFLTSVPDTLTITVEKVASGA